MFGLNARLNECLVLTYRTQADTIRDLLPPGLEPLTHGPWAFWNISVAHITGLRHAGMPEWLGVGCHHIAYRLLVQPPAGHPDSGPAMYQVHAETDSTLVRRLGRQLAGLSLDPADISLTLNDNVMLLKVRTAKAEGDARLCAGLRVAPMPPTSSLFGSLAEARELLPPMMPGLLCNPNGSGYEAMRLGYSEETLQETLVHIFDAHWGALEALGQKRLHLELAVRVAPMDVSWNIEPAVSAATRPAARPDSSATAPGPVAAHPAALAPTPTPAPPSPTPAADPGTKPGAPRAAAPVERAMEHAHA